jgi:hypothetical protein
MLLLADMYTPDYDRRHANDSPFSFDDEFDLDDRTPPFRTCETPCAYGSPFQDRRLPLLGPSDWDPNFRDDGNDPTCIHYDIEWKFQFKKGRLSKLGQRNIDELEREFEKCCLTPLRSNSSSLGTSLGTSLSHIGGGKGNHCCGGASW